MRLNTDQIRLLSGYFSDLSKILMGSVVIGFFIPTSAGIITIPVFWIGSAIAVVLLSMSITLVR